LQKKNIRSQIPSFYKGKKNRHNCLQYEKALKIFYFHILNVAKFGYVHLWDDPQCLGYGDNRDPETRSPSPDLWSPSSDLRLRPSDVSTSIGADDPSGDHLRVHTHKTIARCGCSSRRASSRAASKSSAFVFDSIADYWDSTKIHQRPSIYLFCFLKNLKQTIPNSFFSPAEAWVCP
jgi:hypothetical protein